MKTLYVTITIFLWAFCIQVSFAQEKDKSDGILNGKAINLPKPKYSQEAKDFCASGEVKVEILIDQSGDVISAEAISGDELLRDSAVDAAKKAKFSSMEIPVKIKGIVIYNFVPKNKCITVGIVNKRTDFVAIPQTANITQLEHLQIKQDEIVTIQIIIDSPSGNVIRARTISGNAILGSICENAAGKTKFAPLVIDGQSFNIKALLVYKFKTDGTIDTNIERNDKDVMSLLTNLVKPPTVSCDCRFGGKSIVVSVQIEIDTKGNIIKATAISGHPFLKSASEKAALASKIPPDKNGIIILDYHFTENNRYSAEFTDVEIREINRHKQSP